jgi:molybdopterin-binding protein
VSEVSIGEAARLLDVSPDTVRRLVDDGSLKARLTGGGRRHVDTRSIATHLQKRSPIEDMPPIHGQSARNRFRGIVTRVLKDKVMAQVDVQAGPHRLVSLLSREAADELGLSPGTVVVVAVKATNVVIETPDAPEGYV